MKYLNLLILALGCFGANGQDLYFPPISDEWETLSPEELGWCTDPIQDLYEYLDEEQSKAFIVLKDGKIVLEKYFGSFTQDSLWYWASAGKTLTAFLVGKAQEENYLSIEEPTANYLGEGWTHCTATQEQNISIRNQLTMTSGLDDGYFPNNCTIDTCLQYLTEPGTRWAYHNAPYTLLEQVLTNATGVGINGYTQTRLKSKVGMTGAWAYLGYDNVYFSKPRSMARFGLLIQNDCVWDGDVLLADTEYIADMTTTSQDLNLSYGYLWWLNGKSSVMLPGSQIVFPTAMAPAAPSDMFAALGKNGQILSISKSTGLVVVRMGNQSDNTFVSTQLLNSIWERLNDILCTSSTVDLLDAGNKTPSCYPNPAKNILFITNPTAFEVEVAVFSLTGDLIFVQSDCSEIDISHLPVGAYLVSLRFGEKQSFCKMFKQ